MTFTHCRLRTFTLAAAMAFSVASASAQTPVRPHGQKYVGPVHAAPQVDVTARIDRLDERIAMLTADMRMFVGELKIQAMADLIEALIERQTLSDRQRRQMHGMMRDWMIDAPAAEEDPDPREMEPENMCSPWI